MQYTLTTNGPGLPPPADRKPILITTVNAEAGPSIYLGLSGPVPTDEFEPLVEDLSFGNSTFASLIAQSPFYLTPAVMANANFDARTALVTYGTDGAWRCPGYYGALLYASGNEKNVYVAVANTGSVYVDALAEGLNNNPCSQTDVCHEGDIEILVRSSFSI